MLPIDLLIIALIVLNLTGLVIVALDKNKARKRKWRIPEKTFFIFAILGGSPGVYIGMLLWRHKTRHWYFMLGIPVIFVLQLAVIHFIFLNR